MYEDEIPKHRADKKYKKKTTVVEARYIGNSTFGSRDWFLWRKYRDVKTALEAKQSLERKWQYYQFRINL